MEELISNSWIMYAGGLVTGIVLTNILWKVTIMYRRPIVPMEIPTLEDGELYRINKTENGIEFIRTIR